MVSSTSRLCSSVSVAKSVAISLAHSGAQPFLTAERRTGTSEEDGSSSIDYHEAFSVHLHNDLSNAGFS